MCKILVIEDEMFVLENLRDLLEAEGHLVLTASDGQRGVELAQERLPDLILCDIQMPVMDGYEVLSSLRQNSSTNTIPFLFLTARVERTDVRAGMALGADDYITKPFTIDELLQAVDARLARQATVAAQHENRMNDLRQNMARMLPHELRTPLTLILGYSSLLLESEGALDPADIKESAGSIFHAAERLQRLIQRFLLYVELTLAAQRPGQVQAREDDFVTIPIPRIAALAKQKAQEVNREADLKLDLSEGSVQVGGSYLLVLLEELLENAFKFSEAGTPVQLAGRRDNGAFIVTITDQGQGMTPEQIAQAGAYMQFDRQRYEQQGLGLGLAIARLAAERIGGTLAIESILHSQTTVRVTLRRG